MSLQQHEREYLIAKVTAIDAAIGNLQGFTHSSREQAALELLIATRMKMVEALAEQREADTPAG